MNLKPSKRCTHLVKVTIGTGYSDVLDKRKMRNSLAANYIHSYDASLLKSVFQDWEQPIALIYDCLKVLPNDMDRAMERIKKVCLCKFWGSIGSPGR